MPTDTYVHQRARIRHSKHVETPLPPAQRVDIFTWAAQRRAEVARGDNALALDKAEREAVRGVQIGGRRVMVVQNGSSCLPSGHPPLAGVTMAVARFAPKMRRTTTHCGLFRARGERGESEGDVMCSAPKPKRRSPASATHEATTHQPPLPCAGLIPVSPFRRLGGRTSVVDTSRAFAWGVPMT